MGWGTTIHTVFVPNVTFADVGKRTEFAKTIESLRIEALARAATDPVSAQELASDYSDWLERFRSAVREDEKLAIVDDAMCDREWMKDKTHWPTEENGGVTIHSLYYSRKRRSEILACESEDGNLLRYYSDRMLALWGQSCPKTVETTTDTNAVGDWADAVDLAFSSIWDEWLEEEYDLERRRYGKRALAKNPDGYDEG